MPIHPNAAPLAGLALRCQSDSRLVALSREGHERAFDEIVRRYRPALVAFAAAIVPAHRAEDVVQDSLARAHGALASGDAAIRLKPWLYTIVRNRALNDLRDEPAHEHLDESFDGVPQPPDIAARREELSALTARMKSLPSAQREALVKRELEGRSHTEIAAAMGATPGAVRGLIFRARTALRDGAGMLIPMPIVRALLNAGPFQAEATGTGIGAGAAGLTAGGGGIAAKAGATVAVAILAVGSGIALHDRHGGKGGTDTVTIASGGGHHDRGTTGALPVSDRSQPADGSGGSADSGRGGRGSGSSDGPGDGGPGASSGPGGPGGSSDDSGPGGGHQGGVSGGDDGSGGAERESGDGGHQGSGGGEPESAGGGSEHEGGGTTGGSGSDDSSGSGSDDSSGSGSSGSDDGETSGGDTPSVHESGGDTTTPDDSADTSAGDQLHD